MQDFSASLQQWIRYHSLYLKGKGLKLMSLLSILGLLLSSGGLAFAEDPQPTPAASTNATSAPSTTTPPPPVKIPSKTPALPLAGPTATPKPKPSPTPVGVVQPGQQALTGTFFIVWGDPAPGSNSPIPPAYFLGETTGKVIPLILDEKLAQPFGGTLALNRKLVALTGMLATQASPSSSSGPLVVQSIQLNTSSLAGSAGPSSGAEAVVSGSKPYINVLCKFPDKAQNLSPLSYFNGLVADTYPGAGHYWREQSYNLVNLLGSNSVGWFTLPHVQTYYAPTPGSGFNAKLDELAKDCGALADPFVNFNDYYGINLMFNDLLDAGAWGGSSNLTLDGVTKIRPTTWEPTWGWQNLTVVGHEVGHSFGLPHSAGSTGDEYNNPWDVMGDIWTYCSLLRDPTYGCLGQHTIAYHKDSLGWIPTNRKFLTPGGTQTITLERLAQPSTTSYLLAQIPINGSSTRFYTVEARYRVGNDVKLPGNAVIIHSIDTTRSLPAWVVDADGNGNTGDDGAMWTVGETFSDAANGISVSVNSATASGFVVTITSPFLGTQLTVNGPEVTGTIESAGQENWFRFTAPSARNYMIETRAGTLADNYMYLYGPDSTTNLVAQDDDSGEGLAAKITGYLSAGTYYVRVRAFASTATGNYFIRVITLDVGQGSDYASNFTDAYNRVGGAPSYGYPTDVVKQFNNTGVYWQPLRYVRNNVVGNGGLFHHQTGGNSPGIVRVYAISGNNFAYYLNKGGPSYWLGAPTSDEFLNATNQWQVNFADGYIIDTGPNVQEFPWPSSFTGWKAQYYNNQELLSGPSFVRNEGSASDLDFSYDWGNYLAPLPKQGLYFDANWSARWQRTYTFNPGTYLFRLCGDDGVRLYVDGSRVIDEWRVQVFPCFYYRKTYTTTTSVPIAVEYYQALGGARISFSVTQPLLVYVSNNDPTGTTPGTLSYALNQALEGEAVTFAPAITTVTVNSTLYVPRQVALRGSCVAGQPVVIINGTNAGPEVDGLVLQGGSSVSGLKITKFKGRQLRIVGSNNRTSCVDAVR